MRSRIFAFVYVIPLLGCVAVVGDMGGYKINDCNPIDQDCPSSAQACLYSTDDNRFQCVDAPPSDPPLSTQDDSCTKEEECAPGYGCVSFAGNADAHCSAYCTDRCNTLRACTGFKTTRTAEGTEVGVCAPNEPACNPVSTVSGGCASTEKCHLVDSEYTKCLKLATPTVGLGQTCAYYNECAQGAYCLGSSGNYVCKQLCNIPITTPCPTGTTCTAFNPKVTLDTKEIGYCK